MTQRPREIAIQAAKEFLSLPNGIILDTETTGTGSLDEVIEVAAINATTGEILIDTLVRPTKPFEKVEGIHDIGWNDLQMKPTIDQTELHRILSASLTITYNSGFDFRLIRQSLTMVGLTMPVKGFACAMKMYAAYRFVPGKASRWMKLSEAISLEGIDFIQEHRALSDVILTQRILKIMSEAQ